MRIAEDAAIRLPGPGWMLWMKQVMDKDRHSKYMEQDYFAHFKTRSRGEGVRHVGIWD